MSDEFYAAMVVANGDGSGETALLGVYDTRLEAEACVGRYHMDEIANCLDYGQPAIILSGSLNSEWV